MSELPTLERFLVFTALVTLFAGTTPAPTPKPIIFHVGDGRSLSLSGMLVLSLIAQSSMAISPTLSVLRCSTRMAGRFRQ